MSAIRPCSQHGEWIDDGTTKGCPECLSEILILRWALGRLVGPGRIDGYLEELEGYDGHPTHTT